MAQPSIQQRALDENGKIGMLYDLSRNCVLNETRNVCGKQVLHLYNEVTCEIIDGENIECRNLLKWIQINDDLRLHILLNPELRSGIAELADHYHPVTKYIRIMRIFYSDRRKQLDVNSNIENVCHRSKISNATHIITAVNLGIDVIIVLELPNKNNLVSQIDTVFGKISRRWNDPEKMTDFTTEDSNLLCKINVVKVYSNVPVLRQKVSLVEICLFIDGFKPPKSNETYWPLEYTLQPIESSLSSLDNTHMICTSFDKKTIEQLDTYLINMLQFSNKVNYYFNCYKNMTFKDNIQSLITKNQTEWKQLQQTFHKSIEQLKELLIASRIQGSDTSAAIDQFVKSKEQSILIQNIQKLSKQITDLDQQIELYSDQEDLQIKYKKLFSSSESETNEGQKISHTIVTEKPPNLTNNSDASKIQKDNQHSSIAVQPVYNKQNKPSSSSSYGAVDDINIARASPVNETINILLLGESGVGKTTFVNALVNYLVFDTFDKAEHERPVVLAPVSFVITTGDNYQEHTVKFCESNSFNNEDFDRPGQSVTQQCKSFIFHLKHVNGRKIRIIDTPGFGDTRGVLQDDANMQHILEYINHYTHLNAVCFLLKPNASKVHNFFKTCLTQLTSFLEPNIHQNVVFCFTNARSTFYAPGDTAPLLKSILKSTEYEDTPFKKENTFCFDNESFRYLVARQNHIQFSKDERDAYEASWVTSVKESQKFLDYISKKLRPHKIVIQRQSITVAQLQLKYMIRPILEAIRNNLRNLILWQMQTTKHWIELQPDTIDLPSTICYKCKCGIIEKGHFLIATYVLHEIQKTCNTCKCSVDEHSSVYYKLGFLYTVTSVDDKRNIINENVDQMLHASAEFAYFIMNIAHSTKDDPFWIGLVRMVTEENDLCVDGRSYELNKQLVKELKKNLEKYEQYFEKIKQKNNGNTLVNICRWIQKMNEIPMIRAQMNAVERSRDMIMKKYECEHSLY